MTNFKKIIELNLLEKEDVENLIVTELLVKT